MQNTPSFFLFVAGVRGSSECVANSDGPYYESQKPRDHLHRQKHIEEGLQLEKQSKHQGISQQTIPLHNGI